VGQGGQPNRLIVYDLDVDPPRIIEQTAYNTSPNWSFPLRVSSDDPEVVTVVAKARNSLVEWVLEVEYTYQGKRYKAIVDDEGRPFRVTSTAGFADADAQLPPGTDTDSWP
jgi:hypothetical protein